MNYNTIPSVGSNKIQVTGYQESVSVNSTHDGPTLKP